MYVKKVYGYVLPEQAYHCVFVVKQSVGPGWVRWVHRPLGKTHCETCLKLDGCLFVQGKSPPCPHHLNCHCILEPVDDAEVFSYAEAYSDYRKFDPYLFRPKEVDNHGKNDAFESWGYSVSDSPWLQKELERQALEKYLSGDYTLGKLNEYGQRISIRVTIPRKRDDRSVSFITGWMVEPNGKLRLTTPYGGK